MEFGSSSPTFPPPEPYELPTSYPRELVPIEEPIVSDLPTLPSPPRKSLLDQWFTASTHVIPVANPRTTPDIPLPTLPKWTANKEEFKASVSKTTDELLLIKEKQWRGELDHLPRGRKPMWNCINRYVRNSSGLAVDNGITLFFAHANGFPKEVCISAFVAHTLGLGIIQAKFGLRWTRAQDVYLYPHLYVRLHPGCAAERLRGVVSRSHP
ncbi:hypothetical protein NUW54_g10837 [Trametes sanguinea]|uniref:Uncharacterized protein n=1 Tax=Trametes sanguinea TaxID=158606 RepID=A0ACC1NRZ5_9APHY|nr:hypothetical protein NUW54_g10837 [Trametes sanguinea]